MKTGIKELSEALALIAGVAADCRAAWKNDQKITPWEVARIIGGNLKEAVDGIAGISGVPAEIADLTPEEMDELYYIAMIRLGIIDRSNARDLINLHYSFLRVLLQYVTDLRNFQLAVPKAEVVPENGDDIANAEFPSTNPP